VFCFDDGHMLSMEWNQFEEMVVGWLEEAREVFI
jgi:hypothetical protein